MQLPNRTQYISSLIPCQTNRARRASPPSRTSYGVTSSSPGTRPPTTAVCQSQTTWSSIARRACSSGCRSARGFQGRGSGSRGCWRRRPTSSGWPRKTREGWAPSLSVFCRWKSKSQLVKGRGLYNYLSLYLCTVFFVIFINDILFHISGVCNTQHIMNMEYQQCVH